MALAAPVDGDTGRVFAEGILPSWGGVEPVAEMARAARRCRCGSRTTRTSARSASTSSAPARASTSWPTCGSRRASASGSSSAGSAFGGSSGIAGELGHVRVSRDGPICRCGNRGCLEMFASPSAVARLLGPDVTVARAARAGAAAGTAARPRAIADAGELIGEALATLVTLLNPKLIVVGGDLATTGDVVLDPIRAAIARYSIPPAAAAVEVTRGTLGEPRRSARRGRPGARRVAAASASPQRWTSGG